MEIASPVPTAHADTTGSEPEPAVRAGEPQPYRGGNDPDGVAAFERAPEFPDFVHSLQQMARECDKLGRQHFAGDWESWADAMEAMERVFGKLAKSADAQRHEFYAIAPDLMRQLQAHLRKTNDGPAGRLAILKTFCRQVALHTRMEISTIGGGVRTEWAECLAELLAAVVRLNACEPGLAGRIGRLKAGAIRVPLPPASGDTDSTRLLPNIETTFGTRSAETRYRQLQRLDRRPERMALLLAAADMAAGTAKVEDALHPARALLREMVLQGIAQAQPYVDVDLPCPGEAMVLRSENGLAWISAGGRQRCLLPADLPLLGAALREQLLMPQPDLSAVSLLVKTLCADDVGEEMQADCLADSLPDDIPSGKYPARQEAMRIWWDTVLAEIPAGHDLHLRLAGQEQALLGRLGIGPRFTDSFIHYRQPETPPASEQSAQPAARPAESLRNRLARLARTRRNHTPDDAPIVYAKEQHGGLSHFVYGTPRLFARFHQQYGKLIDEAVAFAWAHAEREGTASDPARIGAAAFQALRRNFNGGRDENGAAVTGFRANLLPAGDKLPGGGRNPQSAHFGPDTALAWGYCRDLFEKAVALLRDESIPLHKRVAAVQELSITVARCSGGLVDALDEFIFGLAQRSDGLDGEAARMKYRLARQLACEFMRANHWYPPGNEVHVVNGALNFIHEDWGFAQKVDSLVVPGVTGYTDGLLERCRSHVNASLTPAALAQAMAEECHAILREAVLGELGPADLREPIPLDRLAAVSQRLVQTAATLEQRFGKLPMECVLAADPEGDWRFVSRPTLLAAAFGDALRKKELADGEFLKLAEFQTDEQGPLRLMSDGRACWTETADPAWPAGAAPERGLVTMQHLQRVPAETLLESGRPSARSEADALLAECLRDATPTELAALPQGWFKRIKPEQLLPQLAVASQAECEALLQRAWELGANLHALDEAGNSLLMRACAMGMPHAVRWLLGQFPGLLLADHTDSHGHNLLYMAMANGNAEVVQLLLEAGSHRTQWLRGSSTAPTALGAAVARGHADAVSIYGEYINRHNIGLAALLYAGSLEEGMVEGSFESVTACIEAVLANPAMSAAQKVEILQARSGAGETALAVALRLGNHKTVRAFVRAIAASNLPSAAKRELLAGCSSNEMHLPAVVSFIASETGPIEERALALAAYLEEMLAASSLPLEDRLELAEGRTKWLPALAVFSSVSGGAALVRAAARAVLDSTLEPRWKAHLLRCELSDKTSALSDTLLRNRGEYVFAFVDEVLRSNLDETYKRPLVDPVDAAGHRVLPLAARHGRKAALDGVRRAVAANSEKISAELSRDLLCAIEIRNPFANPFKRRSNPSAPQPGRG